MQFAAHVLANPSQRIVRCELRGDDEFAYGADHQVEFLARLYTLDFEDH